MKLKFTLPNFVLKGLSGSGWSDLSVPQLACPSCMACTSCSFCTFVNAINRIVALKFKRFEIKKIDFEKKQYKFGTMRKHRHAKNASQTL